MMKYEDPMSDYTDIDSMYDMGSWDYDPLTILLRDEEAEELSIPSVKQSLNQTFGVTQ